MLHPLVNAFMVGRSRLRSSRRKRRYFRWYSTRCGGHIRFDIGEQGIVEPGKESLGNDLKQVLARLLRTSLRPALLRLVTNSFPRSFHYGLQTIRGNLHANAQQHERHDAQDSLDRRWRHLLRDFRSVRVADPKRDSQCDNRRGYAKMG